MAYVNSLKKSKKGPNRSTGLATSIKRGLRAHLVYLSRDNKHNSDKAMVRERHSSHRRECLNDAAEFVTANYPSRLKHFASGNDIDVERICPRLELVSSGTEQARL